MSSMGGMSSMNGNISIRIHNIDHDGQGSLPRGVIANADPCMGGALGVVGELPGVHEKKLEFGRSGKRALESSITHNGL